MAAERYLSRRIPDLRVGNNIDEIDKKLIPASIHPCKKILYCQGPVVKMFRIIKSDTFLQYLSFQYFGIDNSYMGILHARIQKVISSLISLNKSGVAFSFY